MRYKILFLTGLALPILQACCLNCKEEAPAKGGLEIDVSERVTDSIELYVYQSFEVEDGDLVVEDTIAADTSFIIPQDESYSAKAIYKKNGKEVIAIDRDKFEVKERHDRDCADTCFVVKEAELDLVLEEKPF